MTASSSAYRRGASTNAPAVRRRPFRYLAWCSELRKLIHEFLDTEGNSEYALLGLVTDAIEDAREEESEPAPAQAKPKKAGDRSDEC